MVKKQIKQPEGKKAHFENKVYKVSRIRYNSWATVVLKSCDIVVFERELVHIQNHHGKELAELGMTALDFVRFVTGNFNVVYKGSGNSVLLVVKHSDLSKVAAIELIILGKKQNYKINAAFPINIERLHQKELLCTNIAH
jgi:hypothetical protein